MATIRTYICNEKVPVVSYPTDKGLSWKDDILYASIVPVGCDPSRYIVDAGIIHINAPVVECMADILGGAVLNWSRRVSVSPEGDFISRNKYIHVTLRHPGAPCWWAATYLYIWRDMSEVSVFTRQSLLEDGGMIPLEGGKTATYQGNAGKTEDVTNSQTAFVPGELLQVKWELYIDQQYFSDAVVGSYFGTPVFTGGKVIDKPNKGEGSINNTYTVELHGSHIECVPTDFANYQIGDWVFVIKQAENSAYETNRKTSYTSQQAKISPPGEPTTSEAYDSSFIENEIYKKINQIRLANNLNGLRKSAVLKTAIDRHMDDMIENNYFDLAFTGTQDPHIGSDGSTPHERCLDAGYPSVNSTTGENLAFGYVTAEDVVTGWMNSPPHKANILNEEFNDTAIAVGYDAEERSYFGNKFGGSTMPPDPDIEVACDFRIAPVKVNSLGNQNGVFEFLTYDMMSMSNFEKFFEASLHNGVITAIWPDNVTPIQDAACVEISGLGVEGDETITYDWVPIFYHCEYENTTEEGRTAFNVGDEVIVLNPGGEQNPDLDPAFHDMKIVAHKDGVKKCGSKNVLIISEKRFQSIWYNTYSPIYDEEDGITIIGYEEPAETGKAIVWDIDNGRLCGITDIDGTPVEQPVNYYKLANLMSMTINGNITILQDVERCLFNSFQEAHSHYNEEYGQYNELAEEWYLSWFYLQKNELFSTGTTQGDRSIFEYLRLFPSHLEGYSTQDFLYITDAQLEMEPLSYYDRQLIDEPPPNSESTNASSHIVWKLFTDVRWYVRLPYSFIIETPDSDLVDLHGYIVDLEGQVTSETHFLIEAKDPLSEHYSPTAVLGHTAFPYIKCEGDAENSGCYLYCYIERVYVSGSSSPEYLTYSGGQPYTWNMHWKSFMPGTTEVVYNLPTMYEDGFTLHTKEGYNTVSNITSGLYEGEEKALAFEYCDFNYLFYSQTQQTILHEDRIFIFKVYEQDRLYSEIDPEEELPYEMENFTEISNMDGLKTVVDNLLDLDFNRVHFGENTLERPPRLQKIPIISFYKLTFE